MRRRLAFTGLAEALAETSRYITPLVPCTGGWAALQSPLMTTRVHAVSRAKVVRCRSVQAPPRWCRRRVVRACGGGAEPVTVSEWAWSAGDATSSFTVRTG